jgi:hypothetical protein
VRVILDVDPLQKPGADRGLGRYASTLDRVLRAQAEIEVLALQTTRSASPRLDEWYGVPQRYALLSRMQGLYHSTSTYHLVPGMLQRSVCSVQDVIPLDLAADYQRTGAKAKFFHSLLRKVGAIVASSIHTRERLSVLLDIDPTHVSLAPLPVPDLPRLDPHLCAPLNAVLPRTRYTCSLIDLDTPDERKRARTLSAALRYLAQRGYPSVVAGRGTQRWHDPPFLIGVGRVSDGELAEILARASCFVYTSAYEGQGLPPQEALRFGTPVVAMRNSALPEMLGLGATVVDEEVCRGGASAAGAALAMECIQILENELLGADQGAAGREHVKQFTDERFLQGILASYRYADLRSRP